MTCIKYVGRAINLEPIYVVNVKRKSLNEIQIKKKKNIYKINSLRIIFRQLVIKYVNEKVVCTYFELS